MIHNNQKSMNSHCSQNNLSSQNHIKYKLIMKKYILIAVLIFVVASGYAKNKFQQNGQKRPKVAVVLSGGGAKGMAHIGALKVIERAGIPVDIVTGTSMGALIGALYSIGYDSHALDSLVRVQDWNFVLSDRTDPRHQSLAERAKDYTYILSKDVSLTSKGKLATAGLIQGKNLARLFNELTTGYRDSMDFNTLPRPFACVATNIVDNTEYDFHSGRLAEAMRASMSIPGVFDPVRKGNVVLVDGGLRNNFPVDLARELGADYVIGVTVQGAEREPEDITGTAVLSQIIDVNCKNKYNANMEQTDVLIRANTKGYGAASFNVAAVDTLIRRGEEEAIKHWDELLSLKHNLGLSVDYYPEMPSAPVIEKLPEEVNSVPTNMLVSVGARFDTEELAAVQVYSKGGIKDVTADLTIRLGKRIKAMVDLTFHPFSWGKADVSYTFFHNDVNLYDKGDRTFNLNYNEHKVDLNLFEFNVRNFNFIIGGRFDYWHFRDVLMGTHVPESWLKLKDEHLFSYRAEVNYNSEDNWLFATRGSRFMAKYGYYTDDLAHYNGAIGFSEISGMWRTAFPINNMLTFQPMIYGRLLYGKEVACILNNMIGGNSFGRYFEQQMPFAGIGYVELTENKLLALQLKMQLRLTENNYVIGKIIGAQHANESKNLLKKGPMMGYEIAYYYNTLVGPLGANFGYSNKSQSVYFYINLGFEF